MLRGTHIGDGHTLQGKSFAHPRDAVHLNGNVPALSTVNLGAMMDLKLASVY